MPFTAIRDTLAEVAEVARNCPTQTMTAAYRNTARDLCMRARLRELEEDVSTVVGERLLVLADTDDEEVIGIYAATIGVTVNSFKPLTESNSGQWHRPEPNDVPKFYQFVMPNYMAVHDLPNAIYVCRVTKVMQPKLTATRIDSTLVTRWKECLDAGALYRLLRMKGTKWTDQQMAVTLYKPIYEQQVSTAAIQHSRRDNPGASITDELGRPNAAPRSRVLPI